MASLGVQIVGFLNRLTYIGTKTCWRIFDALLVAVPWMAELKLKPGG